MLLTNNVSTEVYVDRESNVQNPRGFFQREFEKGRVYIARICQQAQRRQRFKYTRTTMELCQDQRYSSETNRGVDVATLRQAKEENRLVEQDRKAFHGSERSAHLTMGLVLGKHEAEKPQELRRREINQMGGCSSERSGVQTERGCDKSAIQVCR